MIVKIEKTKINQWTQKLGVWKSDEIDELLVRPNKEKKTEGMQITNTRNEIRVNTTDHLDIIKKLKEYDKQTLWLQICNLNEMD